mmetsp:Transcript_21590/g.67721  ORF Transcript_21590/g.67721 Transcript_21590/m.67721 type:complete len:329 (-) Transcript_21590:1962-2948(-)
MGGMRAQQRRRRRKKRGVAPELAVPGLKKRGHLFKARWGVVRADAREDGRRRQRQREQGGRNCARRRGGPDWRLVVGEALDPAWDAGDLARRFVRDFGGRCAHKVLASLVVDKYHHGPWDTRHPVREANGLGPQNLEGGEVAQPRGEECLEEEPEVENRVAEALLANREPAGLADEEIGPLDDDNRNPVGGLCVLVGVLLDLARGDIEALLDVAVGASISRRNELAVKATASTAIVDILGLVVQGFASGDNGPVGGSIAAVAESRIAIRALAVQDATARASSEVGGTSKCRDVKAVDCIDDIAERVVCADLVGALFAAREVVVVRYAR